MSEDKLIKVNDYLYHQPYKDGKPFNWEMRHRFLTLEIRDPSPQLFFSVNTPGDPKSSTSSGWRIVGKGLLNHNTIGLIRKDGSVSGLFEDFRSADIVLSPVLHFGDKETAGNVIVIDGKLEERSPYLHVQLGVAQDLLETLCSQILAGHINTVEIGFEIRAFNSEVDCAFRGPGLPATYYIEEDSFSNVAHIGSLVGSRCLPSSDAPPPSKDENPVPASPKELFSSEGFHEQKLNFFGNHFLSLEKLIVQSLSVIKNILVLLGIIYLLAQGLSWLSNRPQ